MRNSIGNLPIRRKLTLAILLASGLVLLLACTALFIFETYNFRDNFIRDMNALAEIIGDNSTAALTFKDKESAGEILAALKAKPQIVSANITFADGEIFAHYGLPQEKPSTKTGHADGNVWYTGNYMVLYRSIELKGERIGTLQLWTDYRSVYWSLLKLYSGIFFCVTTASLLLAYLLSTRLQKLISSPILKLAETAQAIADKRDYTVRAEKLGRDEVGRLTDAFNQMLSQIQGQDEALKQSRQRFEVAVLGSSDGIWDWDLTTNGIYYSPRCKTMIGFADYELENKVETFESRQHPADRERVQHVVQDCVAGRVNVFRVEFRLLQKDGTYRWVLSRGASLRDAKGKPFRVAGSHSDISEHKRGEEALRFSQQKFESLVNSINGIVWEADAETFTPWFISRQAEEILGYPLQQWLDEPGFWESHRHKDDQVRVAEALRQGTLAGKPFQLEYRMMAANGRIVWLQDSISVLMSNGKPTLLRGVTLNITLQKIAAQELEQMQQQLITASRQAGMAEVATGVLHNVGNVLNSVNVSASLVSEKLNRSKVSSLERVVTLLGEHKSDLGDYLTSDEKGKLVPELLTQIAKRLRSEHTDQVKELESLTKNVGHIKDIVAMQQNYANVAGVLEPLPIAGLVEDTLQMSRVSFQRHSIAVARAFEPVPLVLVDKHKVLQILINLVRNAKYAMINHPGSEKKLTVGIKLNGNDRVKITVADTGMGIPAENLNRIFAHGFTTKKDGHGFGLHSCALAAKEMSGSLQAHSDGPGTGATFTLELPINKRNGK